MADLRPCRDTQMVKIRKDGSWYGKAYDCKLDVETIR